MSTLSLTLCASTRTGCLSAAIPACAEVTLTLAGDLPLPAGTSLALLTPRGTTLAHSILSEEAAPGASLPLSTLTAQAAEYTHSCRAGDTREALLAIGDSEHPLALVPARIAQNPLYTLAPPTAQAPAYPTSEALHALLAEVQAAALRAENAAAAAADSAKDAWNSAVHAEDCERAAEAAAQNAADGVVDLLQEKVDAAEAAQGAAQGAATSAGESAELAAERLALVPAIAVDAEAALAASRELLGTAPATLVELSAAL